MSRAIYGTGCEFSCFLAVFERSIPVSRAIYGTGCVLKLVFTVLKELFTRQDAFWMDYRVFALIHDFRNYLPCVMGVKR